ncbi:MAG: TonB-dependent receptor [Ekhidna sp.]|uniref:TonB-dependent receptor n=1 Tax=Ekhidna sp. TaxID=2608089 RepID=UPI0032EE738D
MDTKVSLRPQDMRLSEALDEITRQTGITFSYSPRSIPVDQQVRITSSPKSLKAALDDLLLGMSVEYVIVEGKVVLRKSENSGRAGQSFTISGYLRGSEDGETLIGATVWVERPGLGTITNAYGFYSITLPAGIYVLKCSYLGYESTTREIRLSGNLGLDIDLKASTSMLEEVVVTVSDSVKTVGQVHSNIAELSNSTILQKPAVLGEPDVIKSLDILPGIQLFNDGSTFFHVRGGNRDQNQILVDEAPIYNPAHLLGLFSSFMPEAIKDIKIYKGNAGAEFGGRVSSVMDIHTKDGNMKKHHINGRLGLVTTRLSVDGPIRKNHSSFFVFGRRSHIKPLVSSEDFDEFFFSDLTGKVNLRLNQNNRLFLSVFSSKDQYLGEEGLAWENIAGTIRWNHTFNDRLFSNTTFYSSKYEYRLITSPTQTWANHIANASLKTDFTFYKKPESTLRFGFKLSGHNFNPGNLEGNENAPFVPKRNATEFSLYYSNEKQLSRRWLLTYGVRLSTWTNYGRTIEYTIDEDYAVTDTTTYEDRSSYNEYANLEPRIKLTHILNERNFLNVNYTRSAQYINLISNSISPFNNLEVWLPASVNIKPQLADQLSLGWIHNREKWQLNIEGYYKALQNQIDYANQAELLLNPQFEAEIRSGAGTAYGLEAILTKKTGKLTGSLAYTIARSTRKIEGINNGNSYTALSDRPAQFSINAVMSKNERTHFSGTLIVASGSPVTTPTSFYQYAGRTVPIYAEKNNDRLPTYHRLDLGWSHRLNKMERKYNHFISVSIFNFYGQKNSVLRSFNKIIQDDGDIVVPTTINTPEALKSTHTFVYRMVPSISYSFHL